MWRCRSGGAGDRGSETGASRADQWVESSRWGEFLQRWKSLVSRQKHEIRCYACGSELAWWSKHPRHLQGLCWHTALHVIRCVWKLWHRSSAFHRAGRCFNTKRAKAEMAAEPGACKQGVVGSFWAFFLMELLPLGRIAGVAGDLPRCSARDLRGSSCALPRSGLPLLLHGPNQFCVGRVLPCTSWRSQKSDRRRWRLRCRSERY